MMKGTNHNTIRPAVGWVAVIALCTALLPALLHAQEEIKSHRTFGIECMECHTTAGWEMLKSDIEFDHTLTGYRLVGTHSSVSCESCHSNTPFDELTTLCSDCHEDQHKGEFGDRCQDCHTPNGWRSPNEAVAKHQLTRFPLLGAHANADCNDCHVGQEEKEYVNTPSDCISCHREDFEQAKEPNHVAAGFDMNCALCHDVASMSWRGGYEHPFFDFLSAPAHVNLECDMCHAEGYKGTPTDCYGCHQLDYESVKQPDHVAGEYSKDCQMCHQPIHWQPATFDHGMTQFPLQGAHAATPCGECHTTGLGKLPTDCWTCHEQDYTNASFPNHVQGQFDHDCSVCHNFNGWRPANFNHDLTNFQLTGAHRRIECQECHIGGQYTGLPLECQGCHTDTYQMTRQPDHQLVGFTMQCEECHNTEAWQPIETMPVYIDHDKTNFPLLGAHRQVDCQECHAGLIFAGTPQECIACHQEDFNRVKNPDHAGGNFDPNCLTCHTMDGWKPATFDHAATNFPLTGAHQATPCIECHIAGNYNITYTDCFQCHETDFNQVLSPNHVQGQFNHDCTTCHNTTAWTPADFDHATTNFPLTGAHQATPCAECHVGGDYNITYVDCWQCHETDFNQVQSPNHVQGQFNHDCTTCHNATAWKPADFDHATTNFPLTGAHQATPCVDCHVGGDYNITYVDCWQCHETDFNQVQSPNHVQGQFNHDCTTCHNTTAWTPADFDHATTNFPLTGAHRATPCVDCHVGGDYNITYVDCWQCHETDYNQVQDPNHVQGQFNHDCTTCHNTTAWEPADFNHATTNFPLTGAHQATPCAECHIGGDYNITYVDCWQCHESDFNQVQTPNHVQGQFNHDCTTCHNTMAWTPADFDHAATNFPLTGAHHATPCAECHIGGDYNISYVDCWQCHETDFNQVQDPNHVQGQFAHDCSTCHNTTAWQPSTFDHTNTNFPLEGAHLATACIQCHIGGDYNITYTDCYQCHQSDFNQTQTPNHLQGQFSHDCTSCHSTTAWEPSTFDHTNTNFPLEGAHLATPCIECHIGGDYNISYTDCFQCHEADYTGVQDPNHLQGQFNHDCTACHNTGAWEPSTFDHANTNFPLEGAHQATPCAECHIGGDYGITYTDCFQCHEADYNSVQNPNHVSGNFAHNCSICHSSTSWTPTQLNHSQTGLPLEGRHATLQCEDCHYGGDYNITFTDCLQCHQDDFNNAKNPDHVAGQFGNDCSQCHSANGWTPSTFDHTLTNLPLEGAHQAVPCAECHVGGNYNLTYTDCLQCHQSDYNNTTNPNHAAGQFSPDCLSCHTMNGWSPATFDHAQTNFPLQGAHQTTLCQDCHVGGNYNLTYTDCFQCHETDYNGTLNPAHLAGQFPHDCEQCHTLNAWIPSTFDHAQTNFPLQGAHQTEPCQSCHIAGNYQLTYTDCWQCHESDFNATTNPDHAAGQFSHDCTSCHTLEAWMPALFDHGQTNFPLQGAHTQAQCQDCHIGGNYNLTYQDCYQCHQTNYNNAVNPNHATNQFPHDCATCHTQTAWSPSTFDHGNTNFALTGAHQATPCLECHVGGNYQITYTDCYQCHQTDYINTTNPAHATNQFPHDCTQCHTTTAWTPSTFDHANTNFPLQGAHTSQPCSACHISGNYQLTYTDCYQCHQTDYNSATAPANHSALNLSHDCTSCHTQTTWTGATPFYATHNVNAPLGFPISGGGVKHRRPNEWNNCSDCHTTNSTATYCCTTCHEHDDPVDLANEHSGVGGYSYSCTSCTAAGCHPDGEEP